MTARGHKYLQAAEALKKLNLERDRFRTLYELLFEMAVMEGARASGESSPREADFRKHWTVEMIRVGMPPEIIKLLGS